jgi:hypothetical protein
MAANFGLTQSCYEKVPLSVTSAPMRDPLAEHLTTPDNASLLLIDYPGI